MLVVLPKYDAKCGEMLGTPLAWERVSDGQGVPSWIQLFNQRYHMRLAGIILILIGVLALVYQVIPITEHKNDAQLGPINISHDETHNVWIPPVVGAAFVVGGVACLALGARRP